jgi:hypothetical protein
MILRFSGFPQLKRSKEHPVSPSEGKILRFYLTALRFCFCFSKNLGDEPETLKSKQRHRF